MTESCQEEPQTSCCGPHVFTSVLLGVLACVLMTGGVFLAFHRWDPLWLIVSGIGVILVIIGSILHCCRAKQPSHVKACCLPDHLHNHVVLNGGSLTEQLLPLTNARSVSQLSLNMLPGYFPPVVTTYGIEQHSSVVQNINRIIQQQTQQSPAVPGSPGKSFLLLSLPGNTPQANIQNLVAAVYQLDGSVLAETSTASNFTVPPTAVPTTISTPVQSTIPVFKNAEVQTYTVWHMPNSANVVTNMPSTSTANSTSVIMSTQTDDLQPFVAINLMDCSSEPICDTTTSTEVDLPSSSPPTNTTSNIDSHRTSLIDTVDPPIDNLLQLSSIPSPTNNIPSTSSGALIDISETSVEPIDSNLQSNETLTAESVSSSASDSSETITTEVSSTSADNAIISSASSNNLAEQNTISQSIELELSIEVETPSISAPIETTATASQDNSESNSLCVLDVEDCESFGRSSPPPSYEDVALQSENSMGAFGMAYGTL